MSNSLQPSSFDYIVEPLRPLAVPIDSVHLDPANARTGHAVDRIAASLAQYKQRKPIVVNTNENNKIEAGNGTWQAARQLGWTHIAVVFVSESASSATGYGIADNRLGDLSTWDVNTLDLLIKSLDDEFVTGFDEGELDELIEEMDAAAAANEPTDAEPQIDRAAELQELWQTATGKLWAIGEHRLLVGDSTVRADVGRVMGGERADLMVTDPPYGVDYDPNWRNEMDRANGKPYGAFAIGLVQNDKRTDWQEAYTLFGGDVCYVWHGGRHAKTVAQNLEDCGFGIVCQIVWAKNNFAIGRGDYHWKHEPCWYAVRKGTTHRYIGDRSQTTLWEIDKPLKSETGHSTQKPLECMARPIRNHDAAIVYDPFGGSGTTMVACNNLGRKCRMIEIDPGYRAVILERMKQAFGITGVLID